MSILKPPPRNPLEILDDQVIQEARLFVDYHIRPGIFNLLATNKDRFDQLQVLQDMSKHIESIGPSLTGHLSHFNPNQNQLNYIEANFSEMVFPHADRKRFAVFVQPLLIRHFIFWRHLKIREMEDKIAAPECVFINVVSQSELPNKQLEQLCDAAKHFLGLLSSAPFGANLADPAVLAYDSLARGYAKSFLDGFGEILLDDRFIEANDETHRNSTMKGVFTILHEWLIEIGLSEVDAHVVADEAAIYVKKGVIDILIERIFRLTVVEFPQKHRSLKTLCAYMNETKQHGREGLTQLLIEQLRHRLLRMDIDTKEILEAYAKCVESLKEVDPSNVIMLIVCDVIKDYLQKRPDTVRQIITYITCQENRTEMEKNWFFPKAFDMANWRLWQPDPLDAPKESGRIRQSSDMFNMLVQIYGSKMKFLDEYQKLMAERIINSPFTDRDELFEKSCLHSLSMRFSPNELNKCDVMLRDLEVSRLLDQQVAESDVPVAIASKIISSHYWPKITAEHLEHLGSDRLEEAIKMYEERFVAEKPERYIKWIRAKG
ncbi:hypothetical protein WR25_04895 isoform B [Diploscapter pachys]|uniref:Cullin family profile domain-containing protein n=1 Tax=Diploscapter pachys TaxID=2018661 RepID=A0A2A2L1C9_9BILA|nr:hypothetical protein WR25_04895 isoform A [Diploscapter pachys]PAV80062.1 hypothetical protein WR25_04895 isoform B [Diploscapter pachys]